MRDDTPSSHSWTRQCLVLPVDYGRQAARGV